MKTVNSIPFIAIAILLMVNSACTPERPTRNGCDTCQLGGGGVPNSAPFSNAGQDIVIFFPTNFCTLSGKAHDIENNIRTILWSKVSGPSSFLIEHPDSLSTKVSNLQAGVYQFELIVTDSVGMYGKDTVNVTVNGVLTSTIAPKANAGPDKLVYYPTNFTNLYGSMSAGGNIIQTISWSKISGSSSFLIETPNSLGTKVSNLQVGVYQFELFVRDTGGLTDKDTCTVIVGQLSATPNEVMFINQVWGPQGWGSGIIISNVYQSLPTGSVFRVYIKRDNSTNWEELLMDDPNSAYTFYLLDGHLQIFSYYENENDTPDIKLVF